MNIEQIAMNLISKAGVGRSMAMEAVHCARMGQFEQAKECLQKSDASLLEGHEVHTQLLVAEANNSKPEFSILLVHSLEHLMNAMTVRDIAEEFVMLYETKKGGGK